MFYRLAPNTSIAFYTYPFTTIYDAHYVRYAKQRVQPVPKHPVLRASDY